MTGQRSSSEDRRDEPDMRPPDPDFQRVSRGLPHTQERLRAGPCWSAAPLLEKPKDDAGRQDEDGDPDQPVALQCHADEGGDGTGDEQGRLRPEPPVLASTPAEEHALSAPAS